MSRGYPDFEGPKSGIYLKPEWAVKEGVDKVFLLNLYCAVFGDLDSETYTVPTGKTLYIIQVTAMSIAYAAASAELPHPMSVSINDLTLGINRFLEGGLSGFGISLNNPISFAAGTEVGFYAVNRSNHAVTVAANIYGYEV